MKDEDVKMIKAIMETEKMGYAYLEPNDGGPRQEFLIATTPQNLANFIGSHMFDAETITVTDVLDRLILNTCGGFLDRCPYRDLHMEMEPFLIPIQEGIKEAGEVQLVSRKTADEYFRLEDEGVTMAECSMM